MIWVLFVCDFSCGFCGLCSVCGVLVCFFLFVWLLICVWIALMLCFAWLGFLIACGRV